jgi:hypothetical protein
VRFAESINVAIADAEWRCRTLTWLEIEQNTYWQSQIRKRQEALAKRWMPAAKDDGMPPGGCSRRWTSKRS